MKATLMLVVVHALVGCSAKNEASVDLHPPDASASTTDAAGSVFRPYVLLQFEEADGSTAVSEPTLLVYKSMPLTKIELDAIVQVSSIQHWATRTQVDSTVDYIEEQVNATGVIYHFKFHPKVALSPEWYVLKVGPLPAWAEMRGTSFMVDNASTFSVRFRPDSNPVPLSIRICPKDASDMAFVIEYSEPVALLDGHAPTSVFKAEQAAVTLTCEPSLISGTIYAICHGIDAGKRIDLSFGDGLQTLTGVPVASTAYGVLVGELSDFRAGCWSIKP